MFERYIENKELLTLPLSGNKVHIDIKGKLYDQYGYEVQPILDSDGEPVVKIDWIKGNVFYKLALLIAFTFKPVYLPVKYWSLLTAIFADGDNKNIHPSNLVWKYPIGLCEEKYNGFAFIPMFSRYMINRDGVVFDRFTKRLVDCHYNKGYYTFYLKPDIGPRTSLKRHRGLCLAFTDYPANVDTLQVNHINGIAGSDKLSNLEWVTGSENRQHAVDNGLTSVNKPVIAMNTRTNEEYEFNSLKEVCKKLKLNESKVSKYLANYDEPVIHENWILSYKFREHAIVGNTNKCPILVRDLRSGEIAEYESIVECAKKLGITKDVINWRINTPTSRLQPDYLQLKRKTDNTPWYNPLNVEQELLEVMWKKKVLMRDAVTGDVDEFITQRDLATYLNISEATVNQRLNRKNQPIFRNEKDGSYFQLKLKADLSDWRISNDPESEYKNSLCSKVVMVKNAETGEIVEYESAQECSKALKLLTTTLNWRLKSRGQKIYPDGLQFKYKEDEISFGTVDETLLSIITSAPCGRNTISKLL